MTIRRQYSLPNCTLVLEGLSDDLSPDKGKQQVLTILTNAECHFVGCPQKLHGGRFFWENLVKTVSDYAQEFLSGMPHPQERHQEGEQVHLEKVEGTLLHRLTWQPLPESQEEPISLELTAVQLFDLVEAVDQFAADSRTLPDFSLKLQPLPRRLRQSDEPLSQRALPATLGLASLAIAAMAFSLLPVPEVRKPEPRPQESPPEAVTETEGPSRPDRPPDPSPEE